METLNTRIEYYISSFSNLEPILVKDIVINYKEKSDDNLIKQLLELSKSSNLKSEDEIFSKNIQLNELKFRHTGVSFKKIFKRGILSRKNSEAFQKFD
tara:strand:+ start:1122 stop:1415 length:294 start_codon:yes stop_codon:yes gene_type:complete